MSSDIRDVATSRPGPLAGIRVVELASEFAAYAGKLMADMGAEVILVEPPGGHRTRSFGPFVDDRPGSERSLWFWHYNTSKLGVTIDLDDPSGVGTFRRLVATADVVLEAEPLGRLSSLGIDHGDLRTSEPQVVWTSVTPFGRNNPRSVEPATDLTVMVGGGVAWNNGYDDHTTPPLRGDVHQAGHIASVWAVNATLVALWARPDLGHGQLVDVSMHAAANVTTEQATHYWLVAERVVERQTGRHAAHRPTESIMTAAADGMEVHTGFPPRTEKALSALLDWMDEYALREQFDRTGLLEMALADGGIDLSKLNDDPLVQECYSAARAAMFFMASRLDGVRFFVEAQTRGLPVGVVYSPEEAINDVHLIERGFPVNLHHEELGRPITYPGAPIRFGGSPMRLRPAPSLGRDQSVIDHL